MAIFRVKNTLLREKHGELPGPTQIISFNFIWNNFSIVGDSAHLTPAGQAQRYTEWRSCLDCRSLFKWKHY
jgi:hypothetical protein